MTTHVTTLDSPVGELLITSDGESLTRVLFNDAVPFNDGVDFHGGPGPTWSRERCPILDEAVAQLTAYFAGERTTFDLPLAPTGTPFQVVIWAALRAIPYAETISYGELARRVGKPQAARAVGLANSRNPISVVVPCHRVIGADGSLTGYGGGLGRKRTLLELERRTAAPDGPVGDQPTLL